MTARVADFDAALAEQARRKKLIEPTHEILFRPLGIDEFLALDLPPRENLLSPWLPAKGLAMLYAPRGVGKTFVALNLAYAVASGGAFLNWIAPKPRRVLFLDGEMPARTLQERLANITSASDREPPSGAYLGMLPDSLTEIGLPDLATREGQAALSPSVENFDLIIVDNISTLCRSGVENDAESWGLVQSWALEQRRAGRSVLFIHHAGKNGGQRGTSKREDVLDTVIELKRPADYSPDQGSVFELHFTKARGFAGRDAEPLLVKLSEGRWHWQSLSVAKSDDIVRLANEGMSQREIAAALGISLATVNRRLKQAKDAIA